MTRVFARFVLALAALVMAFGVAPQIAAAQDVGDLQVGEAAAEGDDANGDGHADIVGEGFTVGQGVHFIIPDAQPGEGTGGGDAGAGLAHTGVETEAGVAIAGGLFAVGAAATVASRRRFSNFD